LTKDEKVWYYSIMENANEINKKIAQNLIYYRKAAGLTQAELAEKLNYSDKSVSKWESGNGIPDVYTLLQLAKLYNVTLSVLVGEEQPVKEPEIKQKSIGLHWLIMLLSSGLVWLVATFLFVVLRLWNPSGAWWIVFIYAVAVNAILIIVYASIWKYRLLNFVAVSTLVWMSLTSIYLTARLICKQVGADYSGIWCIFLLGVPLQVLEILWVFFRSLFYKLKEKRTSKEPKTVQEITKENPDVETLENKEEING